MASLLFFAQFYMIHIVATQIAYASRSISVSVHKMITGIIRKITLKICQIGNVVACTFS